MLEDTFGIGPLPGATPAATPDYFGIGGLNGGPGPYSQPPSVVGNDPFNIQGGSLPYGKYRNAAFKGLGQAGKSFANGANQSPTSFDLSGQQYQTAPNHLGQDTLAMIRDRMNQRNNQAIQAQDQFRKQKILDAYNPYHPQFGL